MRKKITDGDFRCRTEKNEKEIRKRKRGHDGEPMQGKQLLSATKNKKMQKSKLHWIVDKIIK